MTNTQDTQPIIGLTSKIGTLERRMEHLQRRLDARSRDYADSASADFDRAEIAAIRVAITCMRTHQQAATAKAVLFFRGSVTDLATDIKAVVPADELSKLAREL